MKQILILINMQNIDNKYHNIKKYVKLKMYFALNKNYICIKKKLHIINNLLIKILINVNIMIFKKMNINIKHEIIIINACENMIILISIKIKN